MLETMYRVRSDDREPFGNNWCGPKEYKHFKKHLVATYSPDENSDGQPVDVYAVAAPARFWIIKALPDTDSMGEPREPYELSTGSGGKEMAEWVVQTAQLISEGMLSAKIREPTVQV